MADFWFVLAQSLITLFVILDPIGAIPFFHSLTTHMTPRERRTVARQSVLIAASMLLLFAYAGVYILAFLQVTLYHFQAAAGLLLLVFAIRDAISDEPIAARTAATASISVFPLATPLLAGPGSITAAMLISRGEYGLIIALIVILWTALLAWIALTLSSGLLKIMGGAGLRVVAKLMDILMAAIAVEFLSSGVQGILAGTS